MSWGKIYCDTNWGENKYRTAGSIINEATPDCFQFPEFVSFKDHVRTEGATYEKMQCGIDILLFLGRSISITPQSPDNPTFSGILDTYTGATAGYSTRRLTNTYTGGLIRVRRSSDDAEQDIGYDSNGEDLDIFGLLAFVGTGGTDNGYVTTWYDQTGNGNHATNSTASEQPLIVDGGSIVTEGSKTALDLSSTTYFDLASLTGAFNLFSVISLADKQYVFSKSTDSDMYIRQRTISGTPTYRYRKTVSDYQFASHIVNTRFLFNFNVSNNFVKQNGSQNTNTASTPSEMSIDRLLASSNGTNCVSGIVQELILFDNGNNNDDIASNINNYFNIYTP